MVHQPVLRGLGGRERVVARGEPFEFPQAVAVEGGHHLGDAPFGVVVQHRGGADGGQSPLGEHAAVVLERDEGARVDLRIRAGQKRDLGLVRDDGGGRVRLGGEEWSARLAPTVQGTTRLEAGASVIVTEIDGAVAVVAPAAAPADASAS